MSEIDDLRARVDALNGTVAALYTFCLMNARLLVGSGQVSLEQAIVWLQARIAEQPRDTARSQQIAVQLGMLLSTLKDMTAEPGKNKAWPKLRLVTPEDGQ